MVDKTPSDNLTERLAGLSPAKRALLELRLSKDAPAKRGGAEGIPRRAQGSPAPMSFAQQRVWFVQQLDPDAPLFNLPVALRLMGELDSAALEEALREIVRRHEVLRTTYAVLDGQPAQVIHETLPLDITTDDLGALGPDERAARVEQLLRDETRRPFDLASGAPMRAKVIRLDEREHVAVLTLHHIATDGWSTSIFVNEVAALYEAFAAGRPSPLPALPLQYADYAVWQRGWLEGEVLGRQLRYWREQLAGAPEALELPADRPRPSAPTHRGAHLRFQLSKELTDALNELSRRKGATLFMTLLAAFNALLARYTGQTDICVGTDVANRGRSDTESLVGFFVNQLVLRTRLPGDPTFSDILRQAREVTLAALAHRDVPFEKLVEELRPGRELGRAPLFQVKLVLQNTPRAQLELPGLRFDLMDSSTEAAQLDLLLMLAETPGGMSGRLEYKTDLFEGATVERMLRHFLNLLRGAVADPEQRLSRLPLMDDSERREVLARCGGAAEYPSDGCLHELFESQVERSPDAVALVYENESLSYGELNARANRLARQLRACGAGPEVLVGLFLERSLDLPVAILAALKAGAAYLPLDPDSPPQRLAFMVEDARVPLLVTQESLRHRLPTLGARVICLEDGGADGGAADGDANLSARATSQNTAYVIYTSGSTGRPKGVAVEHRQVTRLFAAADPHLAPLPSDTWTLFHSYAFDFSVWELWGALLHGGRLVVVSYEVSRSPAAFYDLLCRRAVTVLSQTPSAFRQLMAEALGSKVGAHSLRAVVFGGEALEARSLRPWLERFGEERPRLINMYGITETCVHVTARRVRVEDAHGERAGSPVGVALGDLRVYVLDRWGGVAPVGVPGEIYVGGAGLARGYVGRAALTAERFVPDPYGGGADDRLYRSGDMGRYMAEGGLEYLGRGDAQVKVRGFRIELGEVEASLRALECVRDCVVAAEEEEGGDGGRRLVAYVVAEAGAEVSAGELRRQMRERLPDYMIPSSILLLDALPLTLNGKVDRRALSALGGVRELSPSYDAPSGPVEEFLANLWAQIIGAERVGIHDNFFDLGGHSLMATRVLARVREAFEVDIPIRELFESPTVAGLAAAVERERLEACGLRLPPLLPARRDAATPLSFAQQRLWFLNRMEPDSPFYNVPGAVRFVGELQPAALERSLNEIIRRHEALRTTFHTVEGRPVQVVAPELKLELPLFDLSGTPADERGGRARELASEEAQRPFDLARGPLFRARLLRFSEQEHVLLFTMHHIVSDGWSIGVLVREVAALYRAFSAGEPSPLQELPIQYADFAAWQRGWLCGETLERQTAYWRQQLAGAPPVLALPLDRPRPAVQGYRGARHTFRLSPELSRDLAALSRREGVTVFMTLLAAFQTLLSRYSQQEDIVVGSPIANRTCSEVEGLIGFFVNTLVLRTDLSGDPSFRELLRRVRDVALKAYAHQDVPFEKLVEELQPQRSLSHAPVFQVLFVLQNAPGEALELGGTKLEYIEVDSETSKFDLALFFSEGAAGLRGVFEYNTDLFEEATISRVAAHFETLLRHAAAEPGLRVTELPLLSEAERQRMLVEWNDTGGDYRRDACVHELFEEQARRTPAAVAVSFEGERLSYRELNRRANQLAHYLRGRGVGPETLVGVCAERSVEMLVAVLGVLKAGGAYVPLDPSYPKERLGFMLEDSRAGWLLTQQHLSDRLPRHGAELIYLDAGWGEVAAHPVEDPAAGVGSENLAYVIYTSGSTGRPKGVQVQHRAVINFLQSMAARPGMTGQDVLLSVTTLSFDIAALELYLPLCVGGRVELVSRETATDGRRLLAALSESGATVMQATPATWRLMLAAGWEPGRRLKVLCGGEAFGRELASQLAERAGEVWNMYGPTETTIWSAVHKFEGGDETVPLGRPIANTSIHLLDGHLAPVPVGAPGELHIGGEGLARGYLGRPGLTAEKFIPDPFAAAPGARLYKTGDLARRLADGTLEFLGRVDQQVKVRGFRVELGEIEAALNEQPFVRESVVDVREDVPGDKRLVAYVVGSGQARAFAEQSFGAEMQAEHLGQFQTVWEETYSSGGEGRDPLFNIAGWNSSYTGEPIPEEEMREWVDSTVGRVLALRPQSILEIGCGTGLLLFRLAPYCSRYLGTDFSPAALQHVRRHLPGLDMPQVELSQRTADDFTDIAPGSFRGVVLNSVVQYFPDADYLGRVVEGAVRAVEPGGFIFLGDVRSLPLLEAFHTSVEMHRAPDAQPVSALRQRVQKRLAEEEELVLSPAFFHLLKQRLPQIGHVQVLPKRGRFRNELTKFRYDVVLHVGRGAADEPGGTCLDWQEAGLTVPKFRELLAVNGPRPLLLRRVPNARAQAEVAALELLAGSTPPATVGELRRAAGGGVDPEELWALERETPYAVEVSWLNSDSTGCFDVSCRRRDAAGPAAAAESHFNFEAATAAPDRAGSYASEPLRGKFSRKLIPQLRSSLRERLPEYMVPSAFVMLDALPLTPNGKVNRKALPAPDGRRPDLQSAFVMPRSDLEKSIAAVWQEVLQVENVGVDDNFFDLGGHSLLMVQVHGRLRGMFGRELSLVEMFQFPTVSLLAKFLERGDAEKPTFDQSRKRAETLRASALRQRTRGRKGLN